VLGVVDGLVHVVFDLRAVGDFFEIWIEGRGGRGGAEEDDAEDYGGGQAHHDL